ncbi:MAG: hypothetical protein WD114_00160 [Phycisphaerales bacterium]
MSFKIHNCFLILFALLLVLSVWHLAIALIFGGIFTEFVLHGLVAVLLSIFAIMAYGQAALKSRVPGGLMFSCVVLSLLAFLFGVRDISITYGIGTLESHEKLSSIVRDIVPTYFILPAAVLAYLFLLMLNKNETD